MWLEVSSPNKFQNPLQWATDNEIILECDLLSCIAASKHSLGAVLPFGACEMILECNLTIKVQK